jgi:hypothetical protein
MAGMDQPKPFRSIPRPWIGVVAIALGMLILYVGVVLWPAWLQREHERHEREELSKLVNKISEELRKWEPKKPGPDEQSTIPTEPEEKQEPEAGATGTDDPTSAP